MRNEPLNMCIYNCPNFQWTITVLCADISLGKFRMVLENFTENENFSQEKHNLKKDR